MNQNDSSVINVNNLSSKAPVVRCVYAINLIKFSKKIFSHTYLINLTLKLLSALINVSITTQMINVFNDDQYLTSAQCFL